MEHLRREGALITVELRALSVGAVGALSTGSPESVARLADWLQRRTGGSPLFVDATLRLLAELDIASIGDDGVVDADETLACLDATDVVPVASEVADVIRGSMEHVSGVARDLLVAGAVLGLPSPLESWCVLAGISETDALDPLDELLRNHLAAEVPAGVRVAHDSVRVTVYEDMSGARRVALHRRALDALAESAAGADLVRHASAAHAWPEAFRWAMVAGHEAASVDAAGSAAEHYQFAASLIDEVVPDIGDLLVLARNGARQLELANRFPEALDLYRQLEQVAAARGSRDLERAARMGAAKILALPTLLVDYARAETDVRTALELDADPADEAALRWVLMNILRRTTRAEEAHAEGRRSLDLAREHGLAEQRALTATDLVNLLFNANRWQDAIDHGHEAIELWRELNDRPMLVEALNSTAVVHVFRGDASSATVLTEEAWDLGQELQNNWSMAYTLTIQAFRDLLLLDVAGAIERISRGRPMAREIGFAGAYTIFDAVDALAHAFIGDTQRAVEFGELAMRAARAEADVLVPLAAGALAFAQVEAGGADVAAATIEGVPFDPAESDGAQMRFPELAAAAVASSLGDHDRALAIATTAEESAARIGVVLFTGWFTRVRAQALTAMGRPAEAVALLEKGIGNGMAEDRLGLLTRLLALAEASVEMGSAIDPAQLENGRRLVAEVISGLDRRQRARFVAQAGVSAFVGAR